MNKVMVKKGTDLTIGEIKQIDEAMVREFKALPVNEVKLSRTTFFLLKSNHRILAVGELIPVKPVYFQKEKFSVMGIGGVVANEKGKGYGKQIMIAIINYLSKTGKTGVGFCRIHNRGFYEKCGLKVNCDLIKRFVFKDGEETITNEGDDCVVYYEEQDSFVGKVLTNPEQEILLPRKPDW